jgi:hypothetical protein
MSRALVSMMSLAVIFAASPVRAADDDPKEILTRAIKAHGGEEFLMKHPAARSQNKGKLQIPGAGEAEFTQSVAYMIPGKLRETMELSIAGQTIKIVTLMNGDTTSITAMDKEVPITDDIKKAMKDASDMLAMSRLAPLLKDKNYELSIFGETKVDDKPAIGVRVTAKSKKEVTFFFDKKTNLLVKLEHRTTSPNGGGEVAEERFIQEYRKDKDGRHVPKKVLVKHDGKTFLEAESTEFEFLEKIDDAEFKK